MRSNKNHIQQMVNYLSGKMTDKDRYAFERKMEADPFLRDAVDGYEQADEGEINTALDFLHKNLAHTRKRQIVPVWAKMAAVFILVLGIASLVFVHENSPRETLVANQMENVTEEKEGSEFSVHSLSEQIHMGQSTEALEDDVLSEVEGMEKTVRKEDLLSLVEEDFSIDEDVEFIEASDEDLTVDKINKESILSGKLEDVVVEGDLQMNFQDNPREIVNTGSSSFTEMIVYKGRVVDEQGFALPGVVVYDQGTLKGAVTDMEGNFMINAPKQKVSSLAFTSVGFKSKNITPESDSLGEVVMKSDDMAMDEVLVVGYGSRKKKMLKSSSAKAPLNDQPDLVGDALVPEPEIGMSKFMRRVQRGVNYPFSDHESVVEVKVKLVISKYGEVAEIFILTEVDEKFGRELKKKIAHTSKWITPKVNGVPAESIRLVTFVFK